MITYVVEGREFILRKWDEFVPMKIPDRLLVRNPLGGKSDNGVEYINLPFVFDCEVSSWLNTAGEKRATMYVWTCICFDNEVYYGRTWTDFVSFLDLVKKGYGLDSKHKAICYVHNLPYDSHFFLPWLTVTDMFATDSHSPLSFTVDNCINFRCSLRLSNLSLDKIGKEIGVGKVKGFNYKLIRHKTTPLTDEEWKYCMFDVIVLWFYIKKQIHDNNDNITLISRTFTGITRRESRGRCNDDPVHVKMYKNCKIHSLAIMDALEQAFQGGYTHCNSANAGFVLENVYSYDLSSDYPSQMVKRKFPIEAFRKTVTTTHRDFNEWASLMKITFTNISATTHHSVISTNKIISQLPEDIVVDNGRLVQTAGSITMWITEMDYEVYKMFYKWESEYIETMYTARKGYLSPPYVLHCLELYTYKTTLKGETDPDKVMLYKLSKMMINSLYGMSVTNPMRLKWEYKYEDGYIKWNEEVKSREELLSDLNSNKSVFLAYQWGVWVTAYARYDLLKTVKAISDEATSFDEDGRPYDDVVYCDTDSIKLLNGDTHKHIFEAFDNEDKALMEEAMKYLDLDLDTYAPKDPKGKSRPLGVFAYEPNEIDETLPSYRYFKTLGAKRYIYSFTEEWDEPGHFGITIAGLPKKNAKYLVDKALEEDTTPFDLFADGMKIPASQTGKNIVTYVDSGFSEQVVDYLGNVDIATELAYIHMAEAPFEMGLAADFKMIMNKRRRKFDF